MASRTSSYIVDEIRLTPPRRAMRLVMCKFVNGNLRVERGSIPDVSLGYWGIASQPSRVAPGCEMIATH